MRKRWLLLFIILALIRPSEIYAAFEPPKRAPLLREVTVSALLDISPYTTAAEVTKAKKEVENVIFFSSKVFEKKFHITFIIETIEPWSFPEELAEVDLDKALDNVEFESLGHSSEITLAFTKKPAFLVGQNKSGEEKKFWRLGVARFYGNSAIVALDEEAKYTTLHEIAHLFGASHTSNRNSIMHENIRKVQEFDNKNSAIIKENRNREFSKPIIP